MERKPPYQNPVSLKGEVAKVVSSEDGCYIRLRRGRENYQIFVPSDLQSEEEVRKVDGLFAQVRAQKDRTHKWLATARVVHHVRNT